MKARWRRGPRRLATTLATLAAVWFAAGACGEGNAPEPGDLAVRLAGQNQTRALVFRVVGPQVTFTGASGGYQGAAVSKGSDTLNVVIVAPPGSLLLPGEVARVHVPSVGMARFYFATLLEVADPNYALHNPVLFSLSVVKP